MGTLGQDTGYALRQLNRSRGFAVVAILTLALAVAGSALGLAGAVAATRLTSRFLFETIPLDPLNYALIPVLFCLLALAAAWAPARRAAAVDPMIALRNE